MQFNDFFTKESLLYNTGKLIKLLNKNLLTLI